ncbi:MAG: HD domain-containing protein [Desulfomonilaceae bacterium]
MFGSFSEIYELAKPFLDTRNNEVHMRVSYGFVNKLLEVENGNQAVTCPAIILHDVGWKMVPEELQLQAFGPKNYDRKINRIHEVEGAKIARKILEKVDYDPNLLEEIVEIISGHDSRKEALSINDAIVKDADKLWRFSREAIKIDPERFDIDRSVHVHWLAEQIDKWFLTESGHRMALEEQRQRLLEIDSD